MTESYTRTPRLLAMTLVLTILFAAALASAVATTPAAWTDRAVVGATVTAARWEQTPQEGCTAMTASGQPLDGGTCSITSISYSESGHDGSRTRHYHVVLNSNAGSGYIRLTADLSKGSGVQSSFSWANAGVGHGHLTVASGWSCASLPILTGDTAHGGNWGSHSSVEFSVYENRAAHHVQCV